MGFHSCCEFVKWRQLKLAAQCALYTIESTEMTVHLYNDHANGNGNGNGNGKAMGKWWIRIEAKDAEITCDGNGPPAEPPADDGVGVDVGGLGF